MHWWLQRTRIVYRDEAPVYSAHLADSHQRDLLEDLACVCEGQQLLQHGNSNAYIHTSAVSTSKSIDRQI